NTKAEHQAQKATRERERRATMRYAAKKMCSCTFIADRDQESIQQDDLGFGPLGMTKTEINRANKSVTTTLLGMVPRTAEYREDVGCILLKGEDDYNIKLSVNRPILADTSAWPRGTKTSKAASLSNVNYEKLNQAIEAAFDPSKEMDSLKTRAVVVVHQGQIIGESYAKGFDPETEILGWSMTKSIASTMAGILAKDGKLSLEDTNLFPEWTDERANISLKDMLQMQSGLEFLEVYESLSDANQMLFTEDKVSDIPKNKPLIHEPGTHWSYSSGTTNLISDYVLQKSESQEAYLRLPYERIFNKIGMNTAVMETDESGLYIGSSFCYATPRDWAKFGLLYLNEGNWFGEQIVDTSWVDFVSTPASGSGGIYGGQFWLNAGHSAYPDVPEDLFSCNGFQGQYVFIIPSEDLVVVRMGLAEAPPFNPNQFLSQIIAAIN
ncbi:MAG: serine hydrolase, partial [Bacteroidota bacterium]